MSRKTHRLPFFYVVFMIFFFIQVTSCQAKDVSVELVWKLGQAGWVEIVVEKGDYQLIVDSKTCSFPAGSTLQIGWAGWTPALRINYEDFQVLKGSVIEVTETSSGIIRIRTPKGEDATYRGSLQITWQNNHWQIINRVDSEDYLKGVVPIEMSNEWANLGIEALKAQAIAARTYLVKHSENGKKPITDSPDIDQAYAGVLVEGEASDAVEATRGEILVDAQSHIPINALYSSHNGGYSEDAQNVWGSNDIHNVSRPDPYSNGVGGAADSWRFIISAPVLGSTFGLGPIQNVTLNKLPSGRVINVKMEDEYGRSKIVTGRAFVKTFYPFGQPIQTIAFLGSLFNVEKIEPGNSTFDHSALSIFLGSPETPQSMRSLDLDQNQNGPRLSKILSSSQGTSANPQPFGTFIFEGRGWGHGVGMAQWGAYHMAQIGFNYQQILYFYYNNTLIDQK